MPNPIDKLDVIITEIRLTQEGENISAYAVYSVETTDGNLDRRLTVELSDKTLKAAEKVSAEVLKVVKAKEGL